MFGCMHVYMSSFFEMMNSLHIGDDDDDDGDKDNIYDDDDDKFA